MAVLVYTYQFYIWEFKIISLRRVFDILDFKCVILHVFLKITFHKHGKKRSRNLRGTDRNTQVDYPIGYHM